MQHDLSLTAEWLRELLDYDAETGVFTWLVSANNRTKAGSVAGSPHGGGYIIIGVRGRMYLAHRLAWLWVHSEWPPHDVDHINLDKTDNRIANLRLATRSQNKANTLRPFTNTSGVKGVSWHRQGRKWQARIKVNGKNKNLGLFTNIDAAAAAYRHAADEHFGEFARTEERTSGHVR